MVFKGGYWGKILCVDLSLKRTSTWTFDEGFARKYLGGVGLAARIIYARVTKSMNPIGPSNVLVFATGPFQAAKIPSAGRCSVAAKSPLTGFWGESSGGSSIGPSIKKAGFDAIVILGRAGKPVYLWLEDGKAEIRDASDLWNLDTPDTVDALKNITGDKSIAVSSIGQAGENLVRYACIAIDKHGYFGRCGLGAVMGSKNLKAVAVKGNLEPPIADPDRLKEISNYAVAKVKASPLAMQYGEHGQAGDLDGNEANGLLPMRNWMQDSWPQVTQIATPRFTKELGAKRWACPYCVIGCHRRITNPAYESKTAGPEYETLGMIGSNLLIEDLNAVVVANDLCNRYGIDTIELGGVLGWAFECYDNGLITDNDTDGLKLVWGSGDALIEMVHKIAARDGIGNVLAEGLRVCCEHIPQSKSYAVESMGQAVAAHDPRAYFGQTITTIASTRGACHLHGPAEFAEMGGIIPELGITGEIERFDATKKGYFGALYQDVSQFWNSLNMCLFYFACDVSLSEQVDLLNSITGWDVSAKEAQKIGERIVCLQHAFNLKMGLIPQKENIMPEHFTTPHKDGGAAGQIIPWQSILKEYWETKSWPDGIPTAQKMNELGISGLDMMKVYGIKDHHYTD